MKNKLLIFSGAAGSGKGTVLALARQKCPLLKLSVSMTTRAPRPGEVDGREYTFVSGEEFLRCIEEGALLEYTEYCGNYYGTPKKQFFDMLEAGFIPVLEIETDGAEQIMNKLDCYLSVFLAPPDYPTLERRLRDRGTESEESIRKRLQAAREEILFTSHYQYLVINFDSRAEEAAEAIVEICREENPQSPVIVRDRAAFLAGFQI